jgi:ferredoxin
MALASCLSKPHQFLRTGIITLDLEGKSKDIAYMDGDDLFSLLTGHGLMPRKGTCLGNTQCARCAVHITKGPKVPQSKAERILLGDAPEGTHLACAVVLTKEFDGAVLKVDP